MWWDYRTPFMVGVFSILLLVWFAPNGLLIAFHISGFAFDVRLF
jgi:hypothetical protein